MTRKTKIVGLIQTHYLGWNGALDFSLSSMQGRYAIEHVIEKLKSIPIIKRIVIATPRDPKNLIFKKIAISNNISYFSGSREDVLTRCKKAIDLINGNIVVHVMGQHCFIDPILLERMIDKLDSTKSDYVSLPDDFTPYFAGKIYRRNFLNSVEREIKRLPILQRKVYNARFFSFVENNQARFRTKIFTSIPHYSKEYLENIQKRALEIFTDDRLHIIERKASKTSNPLSESYVFALKQMKRSYVVLDIACGDGFGCRIMSPHVKKVIGLDINKELIRENKLKNKKSNIVYEEGDACSLGYRDQSFDAITGMEIIEHISPDRVDRFVSEIRRVLKLDGVLICSTPQNRIGSIPVVPWHKREYSLSEFKLILGRSFRKVKIYGSRSGGPLTKNELGQKMVSVCKLN